MVCRGGLGLPLHATKGIVGNPDFHFSKNLDFDIPEIRYLQHSASIAPGNSGGPLFKIELGHYCLTGINLRGYIGEDLHGRPIPIAQFAFAMSLQEIRTFLKSK